MLLASGQCNEADGRFSCGYVNGTLCGFARGFLCPLFSRQDAKTPRGPATFFKPETQTRGAHSHGFVLSGPFQPRSKVRFASGPFSSLLFSSLPGTSLPTDPFEAEVFTDGS